MDEEIELRPIEPGDKVTGLSLGGLEYVPLKTFLQKKAKSYQQNSYARTYGLFVNGDRIVGYVTLICGEILTETPIANADGDDQYDFKTYPSVKIARLAVDKRYRGRKLGAELVRFSVGVVKNAIMPHVGCRFVVVDSKASAVDFYERLGFTLLDTPSNRALDQPVMFLDMLKV